MQSCMVNCVRMDPCSPHRFFLPLFGWNQYDVNQTHCDSDHIYTRGYQQFISIQFIIVLIANIVLYAIVMRIAMKTAKCRRIMDSVIIHNRSERDFQKLKMMAIILGLFIVCWSPYTVIVTILLFYHYNSTLRFARKCSLILGIINSALNWMVYGWRNKDFKTAFKEIIKCQKDFYISEKYGPSRVLKTTRMWRALT